MARAERDLVDKDAGGAGADGSGGGEGGESEVPEEVKGFASTVASGRKKRRIAAIQTGMK